MKPKFGRLGVLAGLVAVCGWLIFALVRPAAAQTETPPSGSPEPEPTVVTAEPGQFDMALRVTEPATAGQPARLSIILTRLSGDWPDPVLLRVNHPADVTIQQAELDAAPLPPGAITGTSPTFLLPAPAVPDRDERILDLLLQLEPGDPATPILIDARALDTDGGLLAAASLPEAEQLKLAQARAGTVVQATPEPATPLPEPTATTPVLVATPVPPVAAPREPAGELGSLLADPLSERSLGTWLILGAAGLAVLLALILAVSLLVRAFRRPARQEETVPIRPAAPATAEEAPPPAGISGGPYLALATDPSRRFAITGERTTIGRGAGNEVQIPDDVPGAGTVSRRHAAVYRSGDDYVIEDLNSDNGVWVGGRPTPKNFLVEGTQVALGEVAFVFHAGSTPEPVGDER